MRTLAVLTVLLIAVATDESVPPPVWQIALMMLGGVASGFGVAVGVWKIARPHIDRYVKSIVKPLQETANQTHAQLRPNGGASTHDLVRKALSAATDAKHTSEDVRRIATRNVRKIDSVEKKVVDLGDRLTDHEEAGERFVRDALPRLRDAGVTLDDLLPEDDAD